MPLDKSRIQGFGSDGSTSTAKILECPAGHTLRPWIARPGWCDKCGRKVSKGDHVMDCRTCNWYLCQNCRPLDDEQNGIWETIATFSDQVAGPSMTNALDRMSTQFGEVLEAASQEMQEIGEDITSFVQSAIGVDGSDDEGRNTAVPKSRPVVDSRSAQQREEAKVAIADFCNNYPACRVAPKLDELDALFSQCSRMQNASLVSAMYDMLAFSNGELEWQPRLRVLYILEHCHAQGGAWKDVGKNAAAQSDGLLLHLTEVQQCKKKAAQVYLAFFGPKVSEEKGILSIVAEGAKTEEMKKPESKRQRPKGCNEAESQKSELKQPFAPQVDLLDLSEQERNFTSTTAKVPNQSGASAQLDLTDVAPPVKDVSQQMPDLNLLGFPVSATTTSTPQGYAGAPAKPASLSVADQIAAAYAQQQQQNTTVYPVSGFPGFVPQAPAMAEGHRWITSPTSKPPQYAVTSASFVGGAASTNVSSTMPIPRPAEPAVAATSGVKDPFAFVTEHTGIGDAQ